MKLLTVFTPAYNRAHTLPKLFDSLMAQSVKTFEWVVVNDGSTDGTEELLTSFKRNADFNVTIINKENGGKPRAINAGLAAAKGEYFFMVDSDDYLTTDAVEKIIKWCDELPTEDFIGVGAARAYPDGRYLKGVPPTVNEEGWVDATNLERPLYHLDADMCEAYKTEIFIQFPFKVWEGENFAPEQIVLNEIALKGYKLRWHKDIIYYCEYMEDGLTKGSDRLMKKNPMGYAMMFDHMLKYGYSLKARVKCACHMTSLATIGGHPFYFFRCNSKLLGLITFFPGLFLSIKRKKQFRSIG